MKRLVLLLVPALLVATTVRAQANCDQTSVGFTPINDLGTGTYMGMEGGLYPNGSNVRPPAHQAAGLAFASQVQPLDPSGMPDPVNGKVVWLSIGFSNATQEAQVFIPEANALPDLNPHLVLVDGAVGGQTCAIISTPDDPGYAPYWATVGDRLTNAGATPDQVQAIWFKDANVANNTPIEDYADSMLVQCKRVMLELHTRFPNAHLCYVASRIYAGYASVSLNPEPYAYRSGWVMKQLVEDQINGEADLNYSGTDANAPWISWGAYLWADGTTPRNDGLTWICPDDFVNDGTHPSPTGRMKVAALLLDFFTTDSTTCSWFLNDCGLSAGIAERSNPTPTIVPNPATAQVTIQNTLSGATTLDVFDALGRCVYSTPFSGTSIYLSTEDLRPGTYHVVLNNGKAQAIGTLLVAGG